MLRQSYASRLCNSFGQQRKLFLLVFLWTCLCLMLFKLTLFSGSSPNSRHEKLFARSPPSSHPAPEFATRPVTQQAISRSSQLHQSKKLEHAQQKQQHHVPEQQAIAGSRCHYEYPHLIDLQFNNIHWQKMTNKANATSRPAQAKDNINPEALYYLYNAYYDDRWRQGLPSVRILAMIDRIQPPPTNCLLWSSKLHLPGSNKLRPLITRATFVYAWYPKWGNYKDGILQPWIVTCSIPRSHQGLVPDSVSLVEVPNLLEVAVGDEGNNGQTSESRVRREVSITADQATPTNQASMAMPAPFSSSSSSPSAVAATGNGQQIPAHSNDIQHNEQDRFDCKSIRPITNNLPVFNQRPAEKGKFAVCVKGLDFPHEDVSVRLVEWIELLNLLGAGKIFLYNLDVHENISKVLHYYEQRGIVELSPLTLPGDQPNLPEYQHLYLKSKLTAKRQNELIPYNDCLYRNLNSYQYLALLDIDEIIMPLQHHSWYELMQEVESLSLSEQNYSRASYNVRNVYFFDDLAGPMGTTSSSSSSRGNPIASPSDAGDDDDDDDSSIMSTNANGVESERQVDSLERGIPHYLHMMQHVYRSKNYTKPGQYVKCFHNTERVVSLHNHFPMNCFGQCTTYSIPVHLAHLQHYRKDCVGPLKQSCKNDFRVFTQRDTTIWKYKQQMIKRTTRVLHHLNLLAT